MLAFTALTVMPVRFRTSSLIALSKLLKTSGAFFPYSSITFAWTKADFPSISIFIPDVESWLLLEIEFVIELNTFPFKSSTPSIFSKTFFVIFAITF